MRSASPGEIAREVDASRARLDLTIERLRSRLTPLGLLDEAVGLAQRSSPEPLVERGIAALRRNPLPIALIAAGAALLAWQLLDGREDRLALAGPLEPATEPPARADHDSKSDNAGAEAPIAQPQGEMT